MNMIETLAGEFDLRLSQVEHTVALIDEGNTIPFIARYRKEATGGLSDVTLRALDERLTYLRGLAERQEEVIRLIDEQGKLTDQLREEILQAQVLQRVEDLYKPYRQKKATRASRAKERGLEPLAQIFWAQELRDGSIEELAMPFVQTEKDVPDVRAAVDGAKDIVAEMIADDSELTAAVREKTRSSGLIVTEAVDPEEKTVYDMYYEYQEAIGKIPNHRILAVNRGEKEKKLKVKVSVPVEEMETLLQKAVITNEDSLFTGLLQETIADAYKRLMAPAAERETRSMLTERAEAEAVKVFARNTEKLLMVPPVRGARIISIDPGYRTGCKVAVLNETGKLLAYTTVYPTQPKNDVAGTEAVLKKLVDKYKINVIVIGNGTASRETEEVVAGFIAKNGLDIRYTIVNEAGASVYSASKLAAEEYPDLDVTTRGAMSLGRRLQDPLAELVKIPTKSIGVGQYQHDINQHLLESALDNVVEDCVNRVGVDLNTASPSLLAHVAGINMGIARNIVAYREEQGAFTDRKQLKKVSKLGEKTFKQCAGFMRVSGGKNPLDATAVHPESYGAAEALLARLGLDKAEIAGGGAADIEERISRLYEEENSGQADGNNAGPHNSGSGNWNRDQDRAHGAETKKRGRDTRRKGLAALAELAAPAGQDGMNGRAGRDEDRKKQQAAQKNLSRAVSRLSRELEIGEMTLNDIIAEIKKPGRDPREDAPPVVFRRDVRAFEDLAVGMEMQGTVRNVVDFGVFVDIGVKNDGLVHISEMSDRYIKHPLDVVSVGDTVNVRIIRIDREKQKIGLTMKR